MQLTPEFGFAEAAEVAGYLADLGVTHAYLSPILEAVPGSQHGYDVTDHSRIRAELGGEAGFRALAKRLRDRGLGIVLDIVPNHMAVPDDTSLNPQLWSVLRDGRTSQYASWFDIEWAEQDNRMLVPVLGGPLDTCLDDLRVADGPDGQPALRYYDHVFPLRAGTAQLALLDLLDAQHYRLSYWREGDRQLDWRRFFDITTLIGIRVENPAVFDATHEIFVRLIDEGLVDGLRVDHPDGLADPRGYLTRLAAATGGAWVVTEKILGPDEVLPGDWACAGTTGYDALRLVDGLFLDPAGGDALQAGYARFCETAGGAAPASSFAEVAEQAKREITSGSLSAEVSRLVRLIQSLIPGTSRYDAHSVLTEVFAAFPVYRAYVHPGEEPDATARAVLADAADGAKQRLPERLHPLADDLASIALGTDALGLGDASADLSEFVVRFQQTTGPVQAKGVEDTACYRWPRLVSLNEVGNEPDDFGVSPAGFHAAAGRLAADWPATMTTLSTHDTKREEDVRARLAVLAELPGEWAAVVAQWHERAADSAVDPDTEYLVWQTLVGTWPISSERLSGYLTKAIREAKRQTSWTALNENYEAAVLGLGARALDDPELAGAITRFVERIAADAEVNSLGAKLVQLTMPGVPDVYQGCEEAGLSLVDPDNRRPVAYPRTRSDLSAVETGGITQAGRFSTRKLLVTSRALALRRAHPDWFAGEYEPLAATGAAAEHAFAFRRGGRAVTVVTRLPAGLRGRGGWSDTVLPLPGGPWSDVLTGATYRGEIVPLTELTGHLPVALLVPEDTSD